MKALLIAALLVPGLAFAQVAPESAAPEQEAAPEVQPEETREERLDRLFGALANTEGDASDHIASEITQIWARSGSASMDLLLQRGRKATEAEEFDKARAHFSALTRLAPDFAEGWNASATLYFLQDDLGASVAHIERTLAIEPRHFGALAGLALIMERVDRKKAALEAWRRVHELFPGMERANDAIDRLAPEVDGRGI